MKVVHPLDRETVDRYSLTLVAVDGGVPQPMSGSVVLDIDVADSNDHSPRFLYDNPVCARLFVTNDVDLFAVIGGHAVNERIQYSYCYSVNYFLSSIKDKSVIN